MKYSFSATIIFFLSFVSVAQKTGYVVSVKGDTLRGTVNIFTSKKNAHIVVVKTDQGKEKLKVYEVKLIKFNDNVYHTVKINNIYQFAQLIQSGYLSLYRYINYDVESTTFNSNILIKRTGESMHVPNLIFKKELSKFLSDCDSVVQKLNNKAYKKSDLTLIIDDYNTCLSDKTETMLLTSPKDNDVLLKLELADQLINKIKTGSDVEDSELIEMLNDLKSKIKDSKKIPSYLVNSLKTKFDDNSELQELLMKVVE